MSKPKLDNPNITAAATALVKQQYQQAAELAQKVIEQTPHNVQALYILATALMGLAKPEEALWHMNLLIELEPENGEMYYLRAVALHTLSRHVEALKDYTEALELKVRDQATVLLNRGVIYYALKQYDAALADLKALDTLPATRRAAYAYMLGGMIHQAKKEYAEARAKLETAHKLEPANADIAANLGSVLAQQGDKPSANIIFGKGIQLDNPAVVYNNRAYARAIWGELSASLADANQAIEIDNQRPFHFGTRGHTYFLMGSYAEALADFETSARLQPTHTFALVGQALAQQALGRLDQAREIWHKLLQLDARYRSADALIEDFHPAEAFVAAYRELIEKLA